MGPSDVEGFGHLLLFCFDYVEQPSVWQRSMELLANEVMAHLTHLTGNRLRPPFATHNRSRPPFGAVFCRFQAGMVTE